MKVTRSDALAVCHAVGLHSADKWENNRMASKMEALPDMAGLQQAKGNIKDKTVKNVLDAILTALEEEKSITVVDDPKAAKKNGKPSSNGKPKKAVKASRDEDDEDEDEEADDDESDDDDEDLEEEDGDDEADTEDDEDEEADEDEDEESDADEGDDGDDEDEEESDEDEEDDEPPAKQKKGKKTMSGKKDKKAQKPKVKEKVKKQSGKPKVAVDKFGNRVGTRTARINAAIGKKAKSVKEIEKEAKAESIHSHLWKLVQKGFVTKTDEGKYKLKG